MDTVSHIKAGIGLCAITAGASAIPVITETIPKLPIPSDTVSFLMALAGVITGSVLPDIDAKGTAIGMIMPLTNKIITVLAKA